MTSSNKENFTTKIQQADWSQIMNEGDTQEAYSLFHQQISNIFNETFPIKRTKIGYESKLSWLTQGLKNSIHRKHELHTKYLKKNSIENKNIYKKFKNKLSHILKTAERKFYQDELIKNQNNLRKSWDVLKQIINKKKKKIYKWNQTVNQW